MSRTHFVVRGPADWYAALEAASQSSKREQAHVKAFAEKQTADGGGKVFMFVDNTYHEHKAEVLTDYASALAVFPEVIAAHVEAGRRRNLQRGSSDK